MSQPPYIRLSTNNRAVCHCCGKVKARDGEQRCRACKKAGCKFDCGWKRGGKGKPDKVHVCPVIARARKAGFGGRNPVR